MAATIRDIKKMTGLSLATVSKYLNGGNVLPENRVAIEHAIEVLHYEVNEVARGLATNKTKTVGILIPRLDNIFFGSIISEIEDILRVHGYGAIICDCRSDEQLERESVKFLLGKRVDGIITIPTAGNAEYLKKASKRGIPVIILDRGFDDQAFDSVLVDNQAASKHAVQMLMEKGHKKIAIICGEDSEYTSRERLKGYYEAMEEADAPIFSRYVKRGKLEVQHGYEAMVQLLAEKEPPTAVFLTNYEITLGGIIAVNEKGVHFPEEISIVGFDNMMLSQIVKPKLWMVVQPMKEIAAAAANMMLQRLTDEPQTEPLQENAAGYLQIKLQTSLMEGESVLDLH